MEHKNNAVGWFEIPVTDMERAVRFYERVFGLILERHTMGSLDMAWFPGVQTGLGASGSLVHSPEFYKPSENGTLIYFTAHSGDVSKELSRAECAGGKVVLKKTLISDEIGYMGVMLDTEGNRIALHSRG
jgi:predicted enzyme related to lactoylglutathione lyase